MSDPESADVPSEDGLPPAQTSSPSWPQSQPPPADSQPPPTPSQSPEFPLPLPNTPQPQGAWPPPAWPPLPNTPYPPAAYGYYYASPVAAGWWAVGFLIAMIVLDLVTTGAEFFQMQSPSDITIGFITGGLDVLQLLFFIPCAIFFLIWIHRVVANAYALAPQGLTITPGWAVGYFFIPLLNLYFPYKAMQDTWRASEPGLNLREDLGSWTRAGSGAIVGWWWAWWLIYNLLSIVLVAMSLNGILVTRETYRADGIPAILDLLHVVTSAVAMRFVLTLTARQEAAYRRQMSSAGVG